MSAALEHWAKEAGSRRPELLRVRYFGSYARGEAGVGSDLDVLLVLQACDVPRIRRPAAWDLSALPVPVDLVLMTAAEWDAAAKNPRRFARTLMSETRWVWRRPGT